MSTATNDEWMKLSKEIAFLTTALRGTQDGEIQSMPVDDDLRLFQHISTLITIGEFGEKEDTSDSNLANAVSGRIEATRVSIVVSNTRSDLTGGGKLTKITPINREGERLLETFSTMEDVRTFDGHLQDVVNILSCLLTQPNEKSHVPRMMYFIHRRATPKLAARVEKATLLWDQAPLHLVAAYYTDVAKSKTIELQSVSIRLHLSPPLYHEVTKYGFTCDPAYPQDLLSQRYLVTAENVGKWVTFIDSLYSTIESIVLVPSKTGGRMVRRTDPFPSDQTIRLINTIILLHTLLNTKALTRAIFGLDGLEAFLMEHYLTDWKRRHSDVHLDKASEPVDGTFEDPEEEDASDQSEPSEGAGGSVQVLRFCRTITAWFEAVEVIARSASRFPEHMALDVYHVDALPPTHDLSLDSVDKFKTNYISYLENLQKAPLDEDRRVAIAAFLDARFKKGVLKTAQYATVHAEATAIGLVCILAFSGACFGDFNADTLSKLFPSTGQIIIAVSKKCCRACTMLAEILNTQSDAAVSFLLPGTHATFFPWSPPRGVPVPILRVMKKQLIGIFDKQARAYISPLSSTVTSPASSTIDLGPSTNMDQIYAARVSLGSSNPTARS